MHYNAFANVYDFTSVALIRVLPGALNHFSLPMSPFLDIEQALTTVTKYAEAYVC